MIQTNIAFTQRALLGLKAIQLCVLTAFLWGCGTNPVKESNEQITTASLQNLSTPQLEAYNKALSLMESEKPETAEKILQKILKTNAEVPELWLNLALSQYQQEKYKLAQKNTEQLLTKSQAIAQAHNLAGLLAVKNNLFDEAIKHYQAALKLKPHYSNALYNIALLHDIYLQNVPQAIEYYQQYLVINSDDGMTKDWVEHLKSSQ